MNSYVTGEAEPMNGETILSKGQVSRGILPRSDGKKDFCVIIRLDWIHESWKANFLQFQYTRQKYAQVNKLDSEICMISSGVAIISPAQRFISYLKFNHPLPIDIAPRTQSIYSRIKSSKYQSISCGGRCRSIPQCYRNRAYSRETRNL